MARKRTDRSPVENLVLVVLMLLIGVQLFVIASRDPAGTVENVAAQTAPEPAVVPQTTPELAFPPKEGAAPQTATSTPVAGVTLTPDAAPEATGVVPAAAAPEGYVPPPEATVTPGVPSYPPEATEAPVAVQPVSVQPSLPSGGSERRPREGPYRQLLIGIMLLEQSDSHSLTPEQARKLLELIRQQEGVKTAMPDAERELKELLTEGQLDYIAAQKNISGASRQAFGPEMVDGYARAALDHLSARGD